MGPNRAPLAGAGSQRLPEAGSQGPAICLWGLESVPIVRRKVPKRASARRMLATRLCPLAHSSAVLASVGPRQRGSRAPMENASDGLRMAEAGLGRPPTLGGAALQPAVDASLHGRGDACTSGSAEQSTVLSSVDGAQSVKPAHRTWVEADLT